MFDNSVDLNWGDSKAATVYQSVSGKRMSAKPLDIETLMKMISPDGRRNLGAKAKRVVNLVLNDKQVPQAVRDVIATKQFLEDVPKAQQRRDIDTCSTAMFPNYDCKYVIVGSAGSVWIDCKLHGKNARIGFDTEATEATKAFYIDYAAE